MNPKVDVTRICQGAHPEPQHSPALCGQSGFGAGPSPRHGGMGGVLWQEWNRLDDLRIHDGTLQGGGGNCK